MPVAGLDALAAVVFEVTEDPVELAGQPVHGPRPEDVAVVELGR